MKKTLFCCALLTFATNLHVSRAQADAEQSGVVARPVETITTDLPDDGHSMFDRGRTVQSPPSVPMAQAEAEAATAKAKANDKSANDKNANAPKSELSASEKAAAAQAADEASYEAIWRNLLGYKSENAWAPSAPKADTKHTDTLLELSAHQSAQNARLIEQNDLLLKQNEQIIALLQQIAGVKNEAEK